MSFYFEIPSIDMVSQMLRFLESRPATAKRAPVGAGQPSGSLVLSKDINTPVTLIKDDEYRDRFFLVAGQMASPIVRFVLAGVDAAKIADALRQVKEDLDDED